jgi:Uma2 family endonuclease
MILPARNVVRAATLEDLLAIPEEERRCELVEGTIVDKGAATGEHGAAQCKLAAHVEPYDHPSGGRRPGGWRFALGVDVHFDPANTFRPDVAGWRRDRVPEGLRGTPITVGPDWVCEILSTPKRNDLIRKKRVYHRCRVPHYWIVDPEEGTLVVHRWAQDGYMEVLAAERGEEVRAEPFDATVLRVSVLFGDDEPPQEL